MKAAPAGRMPWPLTRAEIESFGPADVLEDVLDDSEDPPVRRWRGVFRRADRPAEA